MAALCAWIGRVVAACSGTPGSFTPSDPRARTAAHATMARQRRRGRKNLPSSKKSGPLLPDEDFAARMGLSPFQWTVQQLALVLACASVCLHAFITLCYGVAPVFVGAPVSLMGLPALVWLAADGVWAWALVCTLRRRWGPPRDLPVDPSSAWRYGGGFCLAAVAVGLAVVGAWQPLWRGLAGASCVGAEGAGAGLRQVRRALRRVTAWRTRPRSRRRGPGPGRCPGW